MYLGLDRRPGWWYVTLAYIAALAVALLTVRFAPTGWHPLLTIFVADVAATIMVFLFSYARNNSSVYDAYWSVAPIAIAAYLVHISSPHIPVVRQALVCGAVIFWGVRLTFNWWRQWTGIKHEDWRYVQLKEQTGTRYWLVSFAGIHLFPTLLVYLGCISLFPALTWGTQELNLLDALALAVTGFAIWLEATADVQLYRFVRYQKTEGAILNTGLWAYSRHPNYLGEILFWWGLYLFALAADTGFYWCIIGPVSITILFVFISIPLHDKRSLARRPAYAEHMKKVPALIPRFKR
jgi:steroid 5-alpha reductase family enzyme